MSLSTGNKLGPYEVVAPLGSGGMSEVFRARDSYGVFGRYDVSADGRRFVVVYEGRNWTSTTLTSVVNWTADLKGR